MQLHARPAGSPHCPILHRAFCRRVTTAPACPPNTHAVQPVIGKPVPPPPQHFMHPHLYRPTPAAACRPEAAARWPTARRRSGRVLTFLRAISSGGERFVHTEEVTGSIPVSPTVFPLVRCPMAPDQWCIRGRFRQCFTHARPATSAAGVGSVRCGAGRASTEVGLVAIR